MDRKAVDFKLRVLSDWSLNGYIRSVLDDVSSDTSTNDRYDANFLSKFRQTNPCDQGPRKKNILEVLKQTDGQKWEEFCEPRPSIDESKMVTEQELSSYLYFVRQAMFRRLINTIHSKQPRVNHITMEDKVVSDEKEEETSEQECFSDVEEQPTPVLQSDFCDTQEITESRVLPTNTIEVVIHKTKRNIFRKFFARLSRSLVRKQ